MRILNVTMAFFCAVIFLSSPVMGIASEKERTPGIGEFGGSINLGTDYVFRGISNTDEGPQIQGDLNWSHESGFYAGIWATNTDYGGAGNSMEFDPYIGFAGPIGSSPWSYDVGYWFYHYPGTKFDIDFGELYGILTWSSGALSVSGSMWFSDDYFGPDFFGDNSSLAYHTKVAYVLAGFTFSGRLGEQTFDEPNGLSNQDYVYYDVGASRNYRGITLSLRWHDTNGVKAALAHPELADGRLVARFTKAF